jgi:predicted molibdopterin-dependent oxidoreductase YjgC
MRFDSSITTTCGYCGVGCRLEAHAVNGTVASISPALDGPANEGHTCLNGRSKQGRTEITAQVTGRIEPGHVFTTFRFPATRTNLLVGSSTDVNTSCPGYKVNAVDVRLMPEEATMTPALA